MMFGNPVCEHCLSRHPTSWDCRAEMERQAAAMSKAFDKMIEREDAKPLLRLYRDCFNEITAKARPFLFDPNDPERIIAYIVPCGPLHRAAGTLGHQMFDGEKYMEAATNRIRELEAIIANSGKR